MIVVVDASVALGAALGASAALDVFDRADELHAPELLVLETLNALRRLRRTGEVNERQSDLAVAAVTAMPVTLCPHTPLVGAVWARRDELSAYDAAYLAIATALDAHLATGDRGLAERAGQALGAERVAWLR